MAKYLKFEKVRDDCEDTLGNWCYLVTNSNDLFLGHLYKEKLTSRSNPEWIFYPTECDARDNICWTIGYLDQLTEFIKTLE